MSNVEQLRKELEQSLNQLCQDIGLIRIGHADQFPFGWRKAAKGRTVWRIVEEIISQNLENNRERYNLDTLFAAESEVGVYDFYGTLKSSQQRFYVNVKSAVNGAKVSKDDISKADKLLKKAIKTNQFFIEEVNKKRHVKPKPSQIQGVVYIDYGIPSNSIQEAFDYREKNKELYSNPKILAYFSSKKI